MYIFVLKYLYETELDSKRLFLSVAISLTDNSH